MGNGTRISVIMAGAFTLAACGDQPFDLDLRDLGNGFDTSAAALSATADRPRADNRGVISYPGYQVAAAKRGDTVADVAARVGLPAAELARHNGLAVDVRLRENEILALPARVAEPSSATGAITAGPIGSNQVDIQSLAGSAIDRSSNTPGRAASAREAAGVEPIRHQVESGETAFTISRLYNVSVRALADWNGLGADLAVREGQFLLIPVVIDPPADAKPAASEAPGETATPEPPSADKPLPKPEAATPKPVATPASPDLGTTATGAFVLPVKGTIIRDYSKGKNDGIDIAAAAGATVVAAANGTVAAITRDTDQVPIVVIRHADNLLTVYAGVDKLTVKKGDTVTRGQKIAVIRDVEPSFLHFEVRNGLDSVNPMDFVN